jgi:hypothetical protein
MEQIIRRIRKDGSNLVTLWVALAFPVGIISVIAVRGFSTTQQAPGDAAVIVMVPCVLTALAVRLLAALVSQTSEPEQTVEDPKPSKLLIASVITFAVATPAILVAFASAQTYGHFGLMEAKSDALGVVRWMFRATIVAANVIAVRGIYLHWSGTIKRIYERIVDAPARYIRHVARLRTRRAW